MRREPREGRKKSQFFSHFALSTSSSPLQKKKLDLASTLDTKQQATSSRLALRAAGLDPASSVVVARRQRHRLQLPGYLSSSSPFESSSSSEGSSSMGGKNAFEAAAEVAAADSLLTPPASSSFSPRPPPRIHVIVTSNGSPYLNYQTRLLFASWRRVKEREGEREEREREGGEDERGERGRENSTKTRMAGFTRILHRSTADALASQVPTLRVAPRTPACDEWCPFPVADRPEAVRSFFAALRSSGSSSSSWSGGRKIPGFEDDEEGAGGSAASSLFFFLAETDYLFLRPLTVPENLLAGRERGGALERRGKGFFSSSTSTSTSTSSSSSSSPLFDGIAFPFDYIQPRSSVVAPILERLFGFSTQEQKQKQQKKKKNDNEKEKKTLNEEDDNSSSTPSSPLSLTLVPNTGPSPVLLPLSGWLRLLPAWVSFTEAIEGDAEAREVLGWIREMVRGIFFKLFFQTFSEIF